MTDYRLLNYNDENGQARPGLSVGDAVCDLEAAVEAETGGKAPFSTATTLTILEKWDEALPVLEAIAANMESGSVAGTMALADKTLNAPILYPAAIFNAGSNYKDHQLEMGADDTETDKSIVKPYMFLKSPAHCVIGPDEEIRIPHTTKCVDWEAELGVVIGRYGRNLTKENARSVVAGYTIFNDLSARDNGAREDWPRFRTDWFSHKSFETSAPLGPWIVPVSSIPDPYECKIDLWVNDDHKQDATAGMMIFNIEEQIEYISARLTLRPGDVIATGTPSGVGRPSGTFLQPGDTVRITIGGIGELKNPVVAGI
ncbi:MAG: fumarylacetoacetate hydrolase family protein [Pseudomonadota bacterium]|nr:fumarylacetoacetate hydrolase family protein [Pseudomonadota bacterium]